MKQKRRITQTAVARRCRLDVSSVNKILNEIPGPVFKPETIHKVFRVAAEPGYIQPKNGKATLLSRIKTLEAENRHLRDQVDRLFRTRVQHETASG